MNILFIGDISARPGREAVKEVLPNLKKEKKIDFVIANAENAAGGRGVTRKIMNELESYGVDYFTAGEHVWDQSDFFDDLYDQNLPLVRPYNYEANDQVPGKGYEIIDLGSKKLIVACFLGQTFMRQQVRSPFWAFDELYEKLESSGELENAIFIVDFHAEATADKLSFGWYIKGRAQAMFGTHTHVPTADCKIMDGKMGYVTDVGMCGPRDASLWVNFTTTIHNYKFPFKNKFEVEFDCPRIFNSVIATFDGNKISEIYRIDKEIQ